MQLENKPPRILSIAGSDPSGGAGIQADIKTVSALGGYAMTAITSLTAQNTLGVEAIHNVPIGFIEQQIRLVIDDIGVDAIKTGMLYSAEIVNLVADLVAEYKVGNLIVDPVMVASSGDSLIADAAAKAIKNKLLPLATIVTPNIPEAEILSGIKINNVDDMWRAAKEIQQLGESAVLLKGGHGNGDILTDILLDKSGEQYSFESKKIDTRNTHGTGCTYASAIATLLGDGMDMPKAVEKAHDYVRKAIEQAPNLGNGKGPIEHRVII